MATFLQLFMLAATSHTNKESQQRSRSAKRGLFNTFSKPPRASYGRCPKDIQEGKH